MRIGIDISQIVYEGTGVSTYVRNIVSALVSQNTNHEYILFGASLRKREIFNTYYAELKKNAKKLSLVIVPIPPTVLDFLWNTLHIIPIEFFLGTIDVFWSSDWTQPPLRAAIGMTTIHDLIPLKFPNETDTRIINTHTRRLQRVMEECRIILCDSESSKKDILKHFRVSPNSLYTVYPGTNGL